MASVDKLLEIMVRLRDPQGGCPWDLEQTFETIAPYTIEEAYEVEDAISRADWSALPGELGDLLLQVVFHAQMAQEEGKFGFAEVVEAICEKLVRRHPHVFGEASEVRTAADQTEAWEAMKARERQAEGGPGSALDGVPMGLPALTRAHTLQRRARRAGFRGPGASESLGKLEEEVRELRDAVAGGDAVRILDELGDVFFSCTSAAGELGIDPETAVRAANAKFDARFRRMEAELAGRGEELSSKSPDELIRLWNELKSGD